MASTAAIPIRRKANYQTGDRLNNLRLQDPATVYAGCFAANTSTGNINPTAAAPGDAFSGVVREGAVSATGTDESVAAEAFGEGTFWFANSTGDAVTAAMVLAGTPCFLEDNETVCASDPTPASYEVGKPVKLETIGGVDGVWVDITGYVIFRG